MRKEEEWKEECMEEDSEGRVGAEYIENPEQRKKKIQMKSFNSQYWLKAAENLLDTDTPQAAIVLGYYAAQAKAEEALAYKNIATNTHGCTYKGVSRVLEEKELGDKLRKAYEKRKDINYNTELGKNGEEAQEFIEDRIKPLIQKLEDKIEEMKK